MIIITEKMIAGGSCITRIDGKAVFIPFSLPGETLEIEITESKKDYSFARIVRVIEPSPHRVKPLCPLFETCGGCTLQMADSEFQKELRLSIVKDVFDRAKLSSTIDTYMISGSPYEYRSRFQFHRSPSDTVSFMEGSSSDLVTLPDCPVAVPMIRKAISDGSLARTATKFNSKSRFHVFSYGDDLWQEDASNDCSVFLRGKNIHFDVRGFFQSNIPLLSQLLETLESKMEQYVHSDECLLDFYSGVGTFSTILGNKFKKRVLLEHNRAALGKARINLSAENKTGNIFCTCTDDKWHLQKESRFSYSTAIIDPPRQGLPKSATEWFNNSGIPVIFYVSCDPATFARDAIRLAQGGYKLEESILFDFYPQTHHVETLGIFIK